MNKLKRNVKKARFKSFAIIIIGLLLCLAAGLALADGGTMPWTFLGSGGGALEQLGIRLQSSMGQPVAGSVSNGLTLCSGFHCGYGMLAVAEDYAIYLPIVIR
ncbi:MAG: hypothetical protein DWQ04_15775 [Chloroflexi bacterium]|nr:MAG: hypothetical protein DWQ04_15775 [Chloroflexota bacterium]